MTNYLRNPGPSDTYCTYCNSRRIRQMHINYNSILYITQCGPQPPYGLPFKLCNLHNIFTPDTFKAPKITPWLSVMGVLPSLVVIACEWICTSGSIHQAWHYVGNPVPASRPPNAPAFLTRVYACRPVGTNSCLFCVCLRLCVCVHSLSSAQCPVSSAQSACRGAWPAGLARNEKCKFSGFYP